MTGETFGILAAILVIAGVVGYIAYNLGLSHGHKDVAVPPAPEPKPALKPVAAVKQPIRTQKK